MLGKQRFLLMLALSICIGTGIPAVGVFLWKCLKAYREKDKAFAITAIIQSSKGQDVLKTPFLAQMMDLSVDKTANLYAFNVGSALQNLNKYSIFKEVGIKKVKPHTLYVDYTLREPIALLANFENTAIDKEGVLFPLIPFYSQKELPCVAFEEKLFETSDFLWGKSIPEKRMELVKDLFCLLNDMPGLRIKSIDVKRIDAPSYGQREIVIALLDKKKTFLRVSPQNYARELANYSLIRQHNILLNEKKSPVVDLRIPEVAYITYLYE